MLTFLPFYFAVVVQANAKCHVRYERHQIYDVTRLLAFKYVQVWLELQTWIYYAYLLQPNEITMHKISQHQPKYWIRYNVYVGYKTPCHVHYMGTM